MKSALMSLVVAVPLMVWAEPITAQGVDALDAYWSEVSRTVKEGDFEGYSGLYHSEAVLVSTSAQTSYAIAQALEGWESGFLDTRQGNTEASVAFRFTQRLHDEATAHETGIFRYTLREADGSETASMVHFQALLVLKEGEWLMVMEYQQHEATQAEWEAAG